MDFFSIGYHFYPNPQNSEWDNLKYRIIDLIDCETYRINKEIYSVNNKKLFEKYFNKFLKEVIGLGYVSHRGTFKYYINGFPLTSNEYYTRTDENYNIVRDDWIKLQEVLEYVAKDIISVKNGKDSKIFDKEDNLRKGQINFFDKLGDGRCPSIGINSNFK